MPKVCTKCGKSFDNALNFCESCGSPLVEQMFTPPPIEIPSTSQPSPPDTVEQNFKLTFIVTFIIGFLIYYGVNSLSHYLGSGVISILFYILIYLLLGIPIITGITTLLKPKLDKFLAFGISLAVIYIFLLEEYPWLIIFKTLENFIYPRKFIISEFLRMLCYVPTALLWAFCVNISMQNAKNSQSSRRRI